MATPKRKCKNAASPAKVMELPGDMCKLGSTDINDQTQWAIYVMTFYDVRNKMASVVGGLSRGMTPSEITYALTEITS